MEFLLSELDFRFFIQSVDRVFNVDHSALTRALLRGFQDLSGADEIENFHPKSSTP
jgi:hypothetical protein